MSQLCTKFYSYYGIWRLKSTARAHAIKLTHSFGDDAIVCPTSKGWKVCVKKHRRKRR